MTYRTEGNTSPPAAVKSGPFYGMKKAPLAGGAFSSNRQH